MGSILSPLLFLIYVNDLPKTTEHKAIPILFAEDTSMSVTSPDNVQFQKHLNIIFDQIQKWCNANWLS
jgi:hypothetical protein